MAEKRMFAKTIIDSDAFIDMPVSARLLYYDLGMRADDDGFINSPKKIQRMTGCSDDDLKLLIAKKFIIPFESGVVVIKHWRLHNYIASDRYKETVYLKEKSLLSIKDNKVYVLESVEEQPLLTECIQSVDKMDTQIRLGKVSLDKYNVEEASFIIDYLNKTIGSKFRTSNKVYSGHINARLKEGFTVQDFEIVIDKKFKEWNGTDMQKFLRPETLFGTKFESYLNAKEAIKDNKPQEQSDGRVML